MPLSDRTKATLAACAEAALPAGSKLPAGGEDTARTIEAALTLLPHGYATVLGSLARVADMLATRHGRRSFAGLPLPRRFDLLEAWRTASFYPARLGYRLLLTALKAAHYGRPELRALVGCRPPPPPIQPEAMPRTFRQVHDLGAAGGDETVEADVAIVGSGAGGAAAARVLASAGLAVVILEAGTYYRRQDFSGSVLARASQMYMGGGLQSTIGNVSILLPTGKAVGGTTTINAGTCLRTPPWILRHWREQHGIPITEADLEPYFARVEEWLEVAVPDEKLLGVQARIVARGGEALGLAHAPLQRNAPGCDAQGLCCFGCPQGAKRSADISLIPAALSAGAVLFTRAAVERIERVGRSGGGEVLLAARGAGGRRLEVKARAVVLAAGSLRTPLLLRAAGVGHPWLGRNLSIHPCVAAVALFPFEVRMDEAVPQGYGLQALREQGLLYEGGATPLELTAMGLNLHGRRLVEVLEQHPRLLSYGFNVRDTSRGRVLRRPDGEPLITYRLNHDDLAQFRFGLRTLVDLLHHGGATTVFPPLHGLDEIDSRLASRAFDRRRLGAADLHLSAYHPLGTARMGADPSTSVVDMELRVRDAPHLLVMDGSVIPTSMGANPQVSIMALAARAAERLASRLG